MGKLDGTKSTRGRYLFLYVLIFLLFSFSSFTFIQEQQTSLELKKEKTNPETQGIVYKSAFRTLAAGSQDRMVLPPEKIRFTIQICTLTVLVKDPFLSGQYEIKVVHMGELYRYIFSSYATLDRARKELSKVQKIFPKAFIREYDGHKLGKAIDLKI